MRETRILEFKETITNTFLKTVSAFSNYDGGTILFGVDDDGNVKGLMDAKQACLDIENKINDSISPQPDYTLETQKDHTIKLTIKSGTQKPYLYKSKAYKRNDTATIEVDTLELSRLILEGKNVRFEELPCKEQALTFEILRQKLQENIQIESFNQDTLKTLSLYNNVDGYTNAAGLLADKNQFPGIDIARFGENISVIQKSAYRKDKICVPCIIKVAKQQRAVYVIKNVNRLWLSGNLVRYIPISITSYKSAIFFM